VAQHVIDSVRESPNNVIFVCESHYTDCLTKTFVDNSLTYTPMTFSKEEITVLFCVPSKFQPKTNNSVFRNVTLLDILISSVSLQTEVCAVFDKCSTKPLVELSTSVLLVVKTGLQRPLFEIQ
jgi:hypothetical protein